MGKSGNSFSTTPEGMPRPSLLSAGAPAINHNILDSMARHVPLVAQPARRGRWLWLLMPVVAAASWFALTQPQQATAPLAAATPSVQVLAPAPVVAAPAVALSSPAATATLAAGAQTSAPNPFNSLDAAATVAIAAPASEATRTVPPTAAEPAAPARPEPPAKTVAKASQSSTPVAAKPKAPKANAAPETQAAKKPDGLARTEAKTAAPATKKPNGRDPDVELLSAIMKHLGEDAAPQAAPARSAQTIADLVKSCKRKDPIDAMLCQRRICEGSWGKAQACPPNLAPKVAAGKTTPVKAAAAAAPTFITEANPAPARR